jgi:hypothetical protein
VGELARFVAVDHVPEHGVVYRSEPAGEKHGGGETTTGQQPPRASGCEVAMSSRGQRLKVAEELLQENTKPPFLSRQISKWFYDTSIGTATRVAHCGSFVGGGLGLSDVSYRGTRWRRGFTWFGPSERNTLRLRENGSYIAVCCSSVGIALVILTFAWPLLAQGHDKYNVTQGPKGCPGVVGSLRTRALPAWCSK